MKRVVRATSILALVAAVTITPPLFAQTRANGPWWPHPIWGPDDQAGGSNWITSEKVLEAVRLVKTGKVYELGNVYERGMPMIGQRTFAMFIPAFPTYGPIGDTGIVFNDEFLCAEIGQVGTQFDGLGHVGKRLTMADGTTTEVFYNGVPAVEMRAPYGLTKLGVEQVKPIITRGILIDVAGFKGVDTLPSGYEVTLVDVRGALARQGIRKRTSSRATPCSSTSGGGVCGPTPSAPMPRDQASAGRWRPGSSSARRRWSAPTPRPTWRWPCMRR